MPKTIKRNLRKVLYNITKCLSDRKSEGLDSIPIPLPVILTTRYFSIFCNENNNWNNCCEHTMKVEEEYRCRGSAIDREIEQFIINVGGSDSETSSLTTDNQSDHEDHDILFESVEYLDSDFDY